MKEGKAVRGNGQGLRTGTNLVLLKLRGRQMSLPPSSKQCLLRSPSHSTPVPPPHSKPASSQAPPLQTLHGDLCLHPPHQCPRLTGPTRGTGPSFPSTHLRVTRRPRGFGTHTCPGPRHLNRQWLAPPTPPSASPLSRLAPLGSFPHLAHLPL